MMKIVTYSCAIFTLFLLVTIYHRRQRKFAKYLLYTASSSNQHAAPPKPTRKAGEITQTDNITKFSHQANFYYTYLARSERGEQKCGHSTFVFGNFEFGTVTFLKLNVQSERVSTSPASIRLSSSTILNVEFFFFANE